MFAPSWKRASKPGSLRAMVSAVAAIAMRSSRTSAMRSALLPVAGLAGKPGVSWGFPIFLISGARRAKSLAPSLPAGNAAAWVAPKVDAPDSA